MLKKLTVILGILTIILSGNNLVYAYQIDSSYRPSNEPFSVEDTVKTQGATSAAILVLQILAGALLYFAAPVAIIMIIIAAATMVISGTEQEKLEQSKKHLTWTVIGLLAIILSYSIVKIIITFVISSASLTTN